MPHNVAERYIESGRLVILAQHPISCTFFLTLQWTMSFRKKWGVLRLSECMSLSKGLYSTWALLRQPWHWRVPHSLEKFWHHQHLCIDCFAWLHILLRHL